VIDKVVGLELGADDYITKPFHTHELIARLKTILRRSSAIPRSNAITHNEKTLVSFNGWKLDLYAQKLINPNNEDITITGHEFAILQALVQSAGRTLTRSQLLDIVSFDGRKYSPIDRSLDVMITKLRKKFGDSPKMPKFIRTIRQAGYMFMANVTQ